MTRGLICLALAATRLAELAYSRRNIRRSGAVIEGEWTRRTYPLVVSLHAAVLGATALYGSRRASPFWLALLLGAQPVRAWILLLLGDRWNTRAAVPRSMAIETRGPYRYVRHPNYAVVAVELLALPMGFGLRGLALLASALNAALLAARIREEEAALMRLPAYRRHFEAKARLIPGVF